MFRGINYVLFYDNNSDESLFVNVRSCCLRTCSFCIIPVTCARRIIYRTNIDIAGSSNTSIWKNKSCYRNRHACRLQL